MNVFADYRAAHTAALALANLCKREVGIEIAKEYGHTVYRIKHLPEPSKRFGWELRAEVVKPTTRSEP